MASQRSGRSNGRRRSVPRNIRFNLAVYESKLREALDYTCSRVAGIPGSDPPDLSRGVKTAAVSYLFSEMLSKYDDQKQDSSRKENARKRFWEGEEMCFWTNLRFSQSHIWISENYPELEEARLRILGLLGPQPPLEEISRGFGFGPGSSTRLPKRKGDACYKYSAEAEVTPNTLSLAVAAISCNPIWKQMFAPGEEYNIPVVWGNRVTTVAKNYKTDRTIAVEPCMNMYVQKGIGSVFRRRLKRVGIDLDDQTPNQVAAKDLSNATIDFSMASDTVSQGIVGYLLPPGWVDLIDSARSEIGVLEDGSLHRYSKVSSMGNGFTFELETLIFWALALSCVPKDLHNRVRVYGDDVLVPRECAVHFLEVTSFCGFKPNEKKSFWEGPFRESCGKHFHSGHDITPFYVKSPVKKLTDLFLVHNQLWRWRRQVSELLSLHEHAAIDKILKSLRNLAPSKWRKPALPDGYGDDAFIGSFAECSPDRKSVV